MVLWPWSSAWRPGPLCPRPAPPSPSPRSPWRRPCPGRGATSSASARTTTSMPMSSRSSGFNSSAASGAVPTPPIVFSKVPECVTGPGDADPDRSPGSARPSTTRPSSRSSSARAGAASRASDALEPCLRLHHRQRRDRPRPAGPPQAMADRQVAGQLLPDGAVAGDRDEIDLADTRVRCWVNGELRQDANTAT